MAEFQIPDRFGELRFRQDTTQAHALTPGA